MELEVPRLLVLTDRHQAGGDLVEVVRAVVSAGAPAIVVREKDLPQAERAELVAELIPITVAAGSPPEST